MKRPTRGTLSVILHADVAGSTELVHRDEVRAYELIQAAFEELSSTVDAYNGFTREIRGDALVAEFTRASDAICAALRFQMKSGEHFIGADEEHAPKLRIGIALGESITSEGSVAGAGVILAQRVEQLAKPGGVCITAAIHEAIPKRLPLEQHDLGEQKLKGFDEPHRVYLVELTAAGEIPQPYKNKRNNLAIAPKILFGGALVLLLTVLVGIYTLTAPISSEKSVTAAKSDTGAAVQKPSLAVLPFANMSGDSAQDYFVDGVTEDIVTDISRLSNLTIIAWSTSSTYKGTRVPPQDIGQELGVEYIVSGSVRKAGDRLRFTAQLVDSTSGETLWAERYDRTLNDIFVLQDEVREKIVAALAVKLSSREKKAIESARTDNVAAYDAFLRGRRYFMERTKEAYQLAREAYREAIKQDPSYARAYGALAIVLTNEYRNDWTTASVTEAQARALELADKAVSLDPSSPQTHWAMGFVRLFRQEYEEAAASAQTSVTLAPNYADGYGLLAFINNFRGRADEAVRQIKKAMVLNPNYSYDYPWNLGRAYYTLGRFPEAIDALQRALERNENAVYPRLFLAASYVRSGMLEDGEWEIEQVRMLNPELTTTHLENTFPVADKAALEQFLDDLKKAGLPSH